MACRSWSGPAIIWTSEIPELEARRSFFGLFYKAVTG